MVSQDYNSAIVEAEYGKGSLVMDTVSVIVISALVNLLMTGLVGGVIIYRFQKDIDTSYNKQMEEFKINLQKISFEQQTKFVRNHEKMVETLETTYQRFSDYRLEINRLLLNKLTSLASGEELNLDNELRDSFTKADKLYEYFVHNSIHLLQDVSVEIMGILTKTKLLYSVINMGLMLIDHSKNSLIEFNLPTLPRPKRLVGTIKDSLIIMLDTWNIKIDGIEKEDFDFDTLFGGVVELLKNYSDTIEKHYRDATKVI